MATPIRNALAFFSLTAHILAATAAAWVDDAAHDLGRRDRRQLESHLHSLSVRIRSLRGREGDRLADRRAQIADAEVYLKAVRWALRFDDSLSDADLALVRQAVERGQSRISALEAGGAPWSERRGKVVRGFVSAIDGSIQPYAVIIPAGYDREKPIRLDVVLHGSSRPAGMSELRFMGRFDERDQPTAAAPSLDYIELHPLGRVENGYRWAGETDVFEAIEATCRAYNIDRDRIVLRGMSMGASGTWHIGLKHPDRFVALGPYCGYVDTYRFSRTPLPNFVAVGPLPPDQEKTLHLLDSVDYAANAGVVPSIACMGEEDVFFEAHEIMKRAMDREGLAMVNLISPGTGHVIDPVTQQEQLRRISTFALRGVNHAPNPLRFVTWSLKYSRCHWLEVLGMGEHYTRAELGARVEDDGTIVMAEPKNVTRLAIHAPVAARAREVRIGRTVVEVPPRRDGGEHPGIVLSKADEGWTFLGERDRLTLEGKRPGVQGPIDDAFTSPFLCVRGTGKGWDPAVRDWAEASLARFSREWSRYFRGDLPVKDDTAVTDEDVRRFNLILFGDPGSNSWIARVLPRLPVCWTREAAAIGDARAPSGGHALVFIQPNPLAPHRYVVLNSGHTFHERELSTLNYLLFPRRGDWAVVKVSTDPSDPASMSVIGGGFFDEQWRPSLHDDRARRTSK